MRIPASLSVLQVLPTLALRAFDSTLIETSNSQRRLANQRYLQTYYATHRDGDSMLLNMMGPRVRCQVATAVR